MKSLLFLSLTIVLLAFSVRSCAWETLNPDLRREAPLHDIVRRPQFPRIRRHIEYPMAQLAPQALQEAALAEMPSLEMIRAKSHGNAHYAPPELMNGLESYTKMVELAQTGGQNAEVAARFFKECAESPKGVTAIRATCVRNYFDLRGTNSELANMSPTLYRVASKLPILLRPQH